MKRKDISRLLLLFFSVIVPCKAEAQYLRLDYDLYAGGLHAMKANIVFNESSNTYNTLFSAEINGFLQYLLPWKGTLSSEGMIGYKPEFHYIPQLHTRSSVWPDETKKTLMKYDNEGNLVSSETIILEADKKTQYPDDISTAIPRNAVDLVTAALTWLHDAKNGKPCDARIPVFDGKRRFDLVFRPIGTEILSSSRYTIFSGETYKCSFELDMKNKKDRKKNQFYKTQEKSKKKGQPPTIWMGRLNNNSPLVPVKMAVYSDYGALIMHLTKLSESKSD